MSEEQNKNPPVRIPEDAQSAAEIGSEEEEDGMTNEQRSALCESQARLIGDID